MSDVIADFSSGQVFRLDVDVPDSRYVVRDSGGRIVALLPLGLGGEVYTRTDRWKVKVERRNVSWAVVAHNIHDGVVVGGLAEGLLPDSHKLWIGADTVYHVTSNPLTGTWHIKDGHVHLVDLTNLTVEGCTITTLEPPSDPTTLPLAILLTLELIKAESSIPGASGGGGGAGQPYAP
jgi:hypothetical protein